MESLTTDITNNTNMYNHPYMEKTNIENSKIGNVSIAINLDILHVRSSHNLK